MMQAEDAATLSTVVLITVFHRSMSFISRAYYLLEWQQHFVHVRSMPVN